MRILIIVLLLTTTSFAIAEDVFMSDLKSGDAMLVSNDAETFVNATFASLCFAPSPNGLTSIALLDLQNDEWGHYAGSYTVDKEPIQSVEMQIGAACSEDAHRMYLVEKSQLLGVITQLQNMLSSDDAGQSMRAFSDLLTRKEEALTELAEIRRIIKD